MMDLVQVFLLGWFVSVVVVYAYHRDSGGQLEETACGHHVIESVSLLQQQLMSLQRFQTLLQY